MTYSDNDLLAFAYTMLIEAYRGAPKKLKWLENNATLEAIHERIADNAHRLHESPPKTWLKNGVVRTGEPRPLRCDENE